MKRLISAETIGRIDSLLCNLQNEGRPVSSIREMLHNDLAEVKYAVHGKGDVAFSDVIKEFQHLGYKPINNDCHISRVGFNVIGIIAGNWLSWSESFWEGIGYKVIDSK